MHCENYSCANPFKEYFLCQHCKSMKYCSPDCLQEDWEQLHRFFCGVPDTLNVNDFQEYQGNSLIGVGALGQVKLILHKESNRPIALKVVSKAHLAQSGLGTEVKREIDVHRQLMHPNIVKLYASFEDEHNFYMLLEFVQNGPLQSWIRSAQSFSEDQAWSYFTETCIGLHYLHRRQMVHRDLKPENILVDHCNGVKICDFGWCVSLEKERSTVCGTPEYMAPEILKGGGYSFPVDLWALGILLYEMLHGKSPFAGLAMADVFQKVLNSRFDLRADLSAEVKDLIQQLIRANPAERLSLDDVLVHPWVTHYAPVFDYRCGQPVFHAQLGSGVIVDVEGLLCTLRFGTTELKLPVTDVAWEVEFTSALSNPPANPNIEEDPPLNIIEVTKTFCVQDTADPCGGVLTLQEIDEVNSRRKQRMRVFDAKPVFLTLKSLNKLEPQQLPQSPQPPVVANPEGNELKLETSSETLASRERELQEMLAAMEGHSSSLASQPSQQASVKRNVPSKEKKKSFWRRIFS